ncbi:helix-turn-helix transcriptional regulator [Clostridium gasigenes]|uniref:helix-turn-helix transcriptional regulator n=1 Tax=Clostridium gasigenes TaxID=94869 RepID=UPI001627CD8D|nr:helix-turn-helix transcriptional regulator [Clostridium gasigenes]MBB6622067.1 helix-turn-helix transcriptional regulator [Clostridium gasigenes]
MNNIKKSRKKAEMTIRQLSGKSKVAIGYLSDLENDNKRNPSRDTMEKISNALSQSVQSIFFPDAKE